MWNIAYNVNTQKAPHISPRRKTSYRGVSIVNILDETVCVTALADIN